MNMNSKLFYLALGDLYGVFQAGKQIFLIAQVELQSLSW